MELPILPRLPGELRLSHLGTTSVVPRPALSMQQSLCWHERRNTLVLDQQHQEFRRIGTTCVPVDDMNIVRAFIEGLSGCQCYLLSTLQLHHNGALQDVNERMC